MSSVSGCGGSTASSYQAMQVPRAADSQRSQELFAKLDVNGDNSIDASELKAFTDYVSQKTGTSSIDSGALLKTLDSNGDGTVTSSELSDNARSLFDALRQQLQGTQSAGTTDADKMFAAIDSNGDGSISADEFKAGLQRGHGGPPPPRHDGGNDSFRMIASLLDQYGASHSSTTTSSASLSVAA